MIYFDNAATGRYKPKVMFDAMTECLTHPANPGRSGHSASLSLMRQIYEARENIRNLFNMSDGETVFTCNCTEALNYAISGILRKYRKSHAHAICTAYDHNSILRPLHALKGEQDLSLTVIYPRENGEIDARDIEAAITPDTRLVAVTHVSNVTGAVTDLKAVGKVCKEKNIPLLADCAQSAGHLNIDCDDCNISLMACAGHKGLHGPQGSGFLLVRACVELLPIKFGGTGSESLSTVQPTLLPDALESGTLNSGAILGLQAGALWTYRNLLTINSRIKSCCALLRSALEDTDGIKIYSPQGSMLVTFAVEGMTSTDVADFLNDADIAVRSGIHCAPLAHKYLGTEQDGLVRVSPGYNNSPAQTNVLIREIEHLVRSINRR